MIQIPIDQEVMDEALLTWGAEAQVLVAVEEAAEFIKDAMKVVNRGSVAESLVEETAHCLFLMMQVRYILGEDNVDAALVDVQERLRAKLKERSDVHTNTESD